MQDGGYQVPEHVGLIGLNDMEMSGWENIDLTTIRQPVEDIVDASVSLVASLLDTPDARPKARLFSCEVVERGTLKPME